jgi:hypothetical protein
MRRHDYPCNDLGVEKIWSDDAAPLLKGQTGAARAKELAELIWREKGRPSCGPAAYVALAQQVLELARTGASSPEKQPAC